MTLLELMILILFFTWFIKKVRFENWKLEIRNFIRNWKLEIRNFTFPIFFLLLIASISIFVSPNFRAALGIWKAYFIEPILFFVVFVSVASEQPRNPIASSRASTLFRLRTSLQSDIILYALSFSALYISLFAIYQKFTGFAIPEAWQEIRRVTSIFEYPNAVGLYLAPIVVLYLGRLLFSRKSSIMLYVICYVLCALSLIAVIFAQSHGALVGILAGLAFLLFFGWNKKKALILLCLFVILIFTLPLTRNYILPIISFKDESGPIRLQMWKKTIEMIKDRPLLGAGLAGYQTRVAPYHQAKHIEIYLYPHNIFLNFWSELGLAGLIVFLWIIIKFYKLGFKKPTTYKLQATILMAVMTCLLVHGLVDVPYFKNDLSILFWLLIGMIVILEHKSIKTYNTDCASSRCLH